MRLLRPPAPRGFPPRLAVALAGSVMLAACGTNPNSPTPGPFVSCPADIQVESLDGTAVPVTFPAASASGGRAPYTISCSPASGTSLPLGTHTVTCTALDGAAQSASCTFKAAVVLPPRLTLTRFLAFGDSLTEGYWNETTLPRLVNWPDAYPVKLEIALRSYYRGQSLIVMNDGRGGELVSEGSAHSPGGTVRLPTSLDENHPDVLLLMEGSNDMVLDYISSADVQTAAIGGLGRMIDTARGRGVRVFLATIPPMNASGTKNLAPEIVASVPVYNDRVRGLAASTGVRLVDVYAGFQGRPEFISQDGLHLSIAGYEKIAQLFFEAIKANLGAPGALR